MPSPPFLLRTTGGTEGGVYWWEEALAEPQKAFEVFEGLSAPRGFFGSPFWGSGSISLRGGTLLRQCCILIICKAPTDHHFRFLNCCMKGLDCYHLTCIASLPHSLIQNDE